jgi:hypothetical protein
VPTVPPEELSAADQVAFERLLRGLAEPNILTWARAYTELGLSVVPVRADQKYPCVPWKAFQGRHATEDELVEWFADPGARRIGVVTGEISGIFVIDVDYRHGGRDSISEEVLADAAIAIVRSPGGRHYWFRNPPGKRIRSRNAWRPGVDKKADRAITLVPPSAGPAGAYEWERMPRGL